MGESLPMPSQAWDQCHEDGETGKQISDSQLGGHKQGTPGALTAEQINCSGYRGCRNTC